MSSEPGAGQSASSVSAKQKEEIQKVVESLEQVRNDLSSSDLDVRLRTQIIREISEIIITLRNYESVGLEKAWELSSSALLNLQARAVEADSPAKKKLLSRLAAALVTTVGIVASANGLMTEGEKLVDHIKGGFALIETWTQNMRPQLEDKRQSDSSNNSSEE